MTKLSKELKKKTKNNTVKLLLLKRLRYRLSANVILPLPYRDLTVILPLVLPSLTVPDRYYRYGRQEILNYSNSLVFVSVTLVCVNVTLGHLSRYVTLARLNMLVS